MTWLGRVRVPVPAKRAAQQRRPPLDAENMGVHDLREHRDRVLRCALAAARPEVLRWPETAPRAADGVLQEPAFPELCASSRLKRAFAQTNSIELTRL